MKNLRQRRKAEGFRELRLRLRDTRTSAFRAEARRQSLAIARSEGEKETMDWLEAAQADLALSPYRE